MVRKDFAPIAAKMAQKRIMIPKLSHARHAREWVARYTHEKHGAAALFLIGIRDLKQVNERYGIAVGNVAIKTTGQRLRKMLKPYADRVAVLTRLSGREFFLVLNGHYPSSEIEQLTRKISSVLTEEFETGDEKLRISPRTGFAIAQEAESGLELLSRAQAALSKAYGRKGQPLAIAAPAIDLHSGIANQLDRDLRDAITSDGISIMLQPQFAVLDDRLIGAEVLARWHHPALGEVGAGHLFAAADRCDMREELSEMIQRRAIAIAANWPEKMQNLRISVNLGADELGERYSLKLKALLDLHGLAPSRLTLELTEESVIRDIDIAATELELLRQIGVRIAVDDFGTGYSSLAYLKTLPLDYLKLDKGMTPDINGTGKDRIVLRAIIAMAKALELEIIAEGVERHDELAMLRAEGCDFYQGFLGSPPLNPEEFERFALKQL
jgi:diguanylate cyclase (GGDEF)-like protein